MAVTFVKRSTLPVAIKGKIGTLSVAIGGNGQITFSSLATKALNGSTHVAMGFDKGKVYFFRADSKVVKTSKIQEADMVALRASKKGGTVSFAASGILKDVATFGTHLYDYKASGNQVFPATVDEKNECITFDLPAGTLTARPVVKRTKKVKPAATKAEVGSVEGTPVTAEELVLDLAN